GVDPQRPGAGEDNRGQKRRAQGVHALARQNEAVSWPQEAEDLLSQKRIGARLRCGAGRSCRWGPLKVWLTP
ncbi:hypothetical protein Q604_UNBC03757G0001, partial [human gut metagenome]